MWWLRRLAYIGTERHESRRSTINCAVVPAVRAILVSSRFYLSLEMHYCAFFAGDRGAPS